ncbi:MAG: ABC transporter ATP-binding protein [Lachnospiraceae bacterium]
MSKNVIEVKDLTIRYNKASQKVDNLKEYIIKAIRHELRYQEFLALQDINLTVKKGEAWGIIGTNGSGKSTLLKVISGIMKPYKGTVDINGAISPLIELGAGFDGNLTARENIYLNGTVLGNSTKFMREHFDEIVDFAELHAFLDSPIKNFSSGMKARLGFAVATMVNPDILIVDEILAVGDFKFKKKCMTRMEKMLEGGTTLLYVSHQIKSVKVLCDHAIWLDKGQIVMSGDVDTVCDAYIGEDGKTEGLSKLESSINEAVL